jgi:hypothetical protein
LVVDRTIVGIAVGMGVAGVVEMEIVFAGVVVVVAITEMAASAMIHTRQSSANSIQRRRAGRARSFCRGVAASRGSRGAKVTIGRSRDNKAFARKARANG